MLSLLVEVLEGDLGGEYLVLLLLFTYLESMDGILATFRIDIL